MKELYNLPNMQNFSRIIEELVRDKNLSYIDAIVWHCENNNIEIETGAKLINSIIKKKIEAEASKLNCLTVKSAKLPI